MNKFSWLVALILAIITIAFTVFNTGDVTIHFWPLAPVALPIFLVALGGIFVGFLFGAIVAWFGFSRTRSRLREKSRQLDTTSREVAIQRRRIEKFEAAEKQAQAKLPPAAAA